MWVQNQQSQQQRSQRSQQGQHHQPQTSRISLPDTPRGHGQDDIGSGLHSNHHGNRSSIFYSGGSSPNNRLPSPTTPGSGWSPQRPAEQILPPEEPSSIVRRISDKGGGSLPGSPTRDGNRYGRTDELVGLLNEEIKRFSAMQRRVMSGLQEYYICNGGDTVLCSICFSIFLNERGRWGHLTPVQRVVVGAGLLQSPV